MTELLSRPRTLLSIAGAKPHPPHLGRSVLVLIDAQNDYLDGGLPLCGIDEAIEEARSLLDAARQAGAAIIHIVHQAAPGAPLFASGSYGAEIIAALRPAKDEPVVAKSLPNGFAGTDLGAHIEAYRARDRTELVIAGFMTHVCVEATARAALDRGHLATVVAAATATRDLPDPLDGAVIAAADLQRASLAALADRSALIVPNAGALPH